MNNLSKFDESLLPTEEFSVCITGNRLVTNQDILKIKEVIYKLVTNSKIEEIYFGGAIGTDTIALQAALDVVCLDKPELIAVVPDTHKSQPLEARDALFKADQLIELRNQITQNDGYRSYQIRNEYMVDHSIVTVAFWDNTIKSGTYNCLAYALKNNKIVLHVEIEGKDK